MGGHPVREIACAICARSVDMQTNFIADENGKAVHEQCYVQRITNQLHTGSGARLRERLL
jgi:hypothetical protein